MMTKILTDKSKLVINILIEKLSNKNQTDLEMTLNASSILQFEMVNNDGSPELQLA